MKHKHADLIHQWADGAEIQWSFGDGEWYDISNVPEWKDTLQYRIKPEEKKPVVRWLWASLNGGLCEEMLSDSEHAFNKLQDVYPIKLEWSRTEFPE